MPGQQVKWTKTVDQPLQNPLYILLPSVIFVYYYAGLLVLFW